MDVFEVLKVLREKSKNIDNTSCVENNIVNGFMLAIDCIEEIDDIKSIEFKSNRERIAQLHREIEKRDRKINELESQLVVKDSIIRKQGIMLAEM